MSFSPLPRLFVTTVAVADPGSLLAFSEREHPLLWLREGEGLAGYGEALRLEFSGTTRFTDAATAWRELGELAEVDDAVRLPGTGLTALGAFTFSARSERSSVLVIPEIILGRSAGRAWVTRIGTAPHHATAYPERDPLGEGVRLEFGTGAQSPADHLRNVRTAIHHIAIGDVKKIVLARTLTGVLPEGADRRRIFADLAASYPECWTYSVDGMTGSSPETLLRVRGGELSTRVLAGTAARGIDADADARAAADLMTSDKDRDEHGFAARSVLAALAPHAADLVGGDAPFTLRLPNLWHLATDISGRIRDGSDSLGLLDALHPTAAVAGTPTAEAVRLIDEIEPFDRGRYAGPIGWLDAQGNSEWAIALRGAQLDADGTVTAYAGGGIVAESDPESELAETRMKFRPILDALS